MRPDPPSSGEHDRPPGGFRIGRLEAFSDGVYAIAITLLVLDLSIPSGSGDDLATAFLEQWPAYLAYIVSFATIGASWVAHSAITQHVERSDSGFARLNLLLLLVVSFLTFPTSLVAEYITQEGAVRVAVTILGLNLLLIATVTSLLWRYASRRLAQSDASEEDIRLLTQRLTPGVAGYLLTIVLGLFLPLVAVFGYLALALFLLLPLRLGR